MVENANFYDTAFAETAGDIAENTIIRTQFTPFELADENPATADYLELMERYNPGGKVGAARHAGDVGASCCSPRRPSACGAELTRTCLLEEAGSVTEWTGGGLHAAAGPVDEHAVGECFALLDVTADGFVIDEELTAAERGHLQLRPRQRDRRRRRAQPSWTSSSPPPSPACARPGIFAIAASGLVLTYTTTGIFNFAHGAIGMLAAFAYWQLLEWGLPTGLARRRRPARARRRCSARSSSAVVMRGLSDAPETSRLVVSVALLAAVLGARPSGSGRPTRPARSTSSSRATSSTILGVRVSWHELLAFLLAIVVAVGLCGSSCAAPAPASRCGRSSTTAASPSLNGARPDRSSLFAWALGCSLAALAGILLAPLQTLAHLPLTLLIVNAYAAAMLGRLRNLPLTFLGAAAARPARQLRRSPTCRTTAPLEPCFRRSGRRSRSSSSSSC